jgi:hypothetical protein
MIFSERGFPKEFIKKNKKKSPSKSNENYSPCTNNRNINFCTLWSFVWKWVATIPQINTNLGWLCSKFKRIIQLEVNVSHGNDHNTVP